MKPLLMTGGIFVLIATSALGQTLPASSTPPLAAKAAEPGIAKPVETSTKSGSALEFKAADEKEVLPPPAPPVIPAVRNAPKAADTGAAVSLPPPGSRRLRSRHPRPRRPGPESSRRLPVPPSSRILRLLQGGAPHPQSHLCKHLLSPGHISLARWMFWRFGSGMTKSFPGCRMLPPMAPSLCSSSGS